MPADTHLKDVSGCIREHSINASQIWLKKTLNGEIVHFSDGRVVVFAINRREKRRIEGRFWLRLDGSTELQSSSTLKGLSYSILITNGMEKVPDSEIPIEGIQTLTVITTTFFQFRFCQVKSLGVIFKKGRSIVRYSVSNRNVATIFISGRKGFSALMI